ncbi:homolog to HGPV1-ORF14 (plasmid) [Natronomonas pharaonis DSM 2160]|uniref:Homolog to HGPV1-ORF14 n=1 Tax=Natronomonas pharaonis (strain ATCC 35678 / DSM 2160 / CIP 103997 / JCM 8858 / NBRC 14720 / NCIMB 2260 / Gabara) TaxID=348780 RepID=Q3ILS7_NATPD|nr:hypothetical protein [Natronomonas pharaonis]CAI49756.3 homolog to HGPV1-ORF14 [Natronomonas pharaonis DSM 2160]CAI50943.3 homolog to HGPV1-ORF14 [Natronomonas pharaonis DSM 2160]
MTSVEDEFAALDEAEPSGRFEVEDDQEEKDIDPYESEDHGHAGPELVKPQVHGLNAHLLFAPFETKPDVDGMRPYFAIVSAFEPDLEAEFKCDGTTWKIDHGIDSVDDYDNSTIRYWDGSIATREQDSGDNYLEYQIPIYDADDEKRNRRVNFQFRPALPEACHAETGNRIRSMPETLPEGVRVQVQASNVDPEIVLELLQSLASNIGVNSHYFEADAVHEWSRIMGLEYYVRCQRELVNELVIGKMALFDRLSQFERQRSGCGELKWDNGEAFGRRHHVALDAEQLSHLYQEHDVGKLIKSYLMKHPGEDTDSDTATEHPKIEVQYNREYTYCGHLPWFAEDAGDGSPDVGWKLLSKRLQSLLMNVLDWAELPRTPGHDAFVSDDHFDADARLEPDVASDLTLVPDPIDEVADAERDVVTNELLDEPPTDAEKDVLGAAAEKGAFERLQDLAEEAGVSSSTASRTVRKFETLFSRLDSIQLADEVVRDRVQDLLAGVEQRLDRVNKGLDLLASGRNEIDEDSALGQWARRWGVKIAESSDRWSDQLRVAIVGGNLTESELLSVLRAGYEAADMTQSVDVAQFASAEVSYYDRDGEKVDIGEWVGVNQGGRTKLLGKLEVDALH